MVKLFPDFIREEFQLLLFNADRLMGHLLSQGEMANGCRVESELNGARFQGKQVAEIAAILFR
jgi:hypothetical protein